MNDNIQKDYKNMLAFGNAIGKAYQIRDDLLDVQGDEKILGKRTNKDLFKMRMI